MLLDTYSNPAGSISITWPNWMPEGLIVTVTSSPTATDDKEMDRLPPIGAGLTVTRVAPRTALERPSWSLRVPDNVYDPAVEALTM